MACGQFGDRRPIVHPELLRLRGAPRARAIDGPGLRADRPLISPSGHLDGEVPDAARGDEQPAARVGGHPFGYGTAWVWHGGQSATRRSRSKSEPPWARLTTTEQTQ